jgi:hypothetical protein
MKETYREIIDRINHKYAKMESCILDGLSDDMKFKLALLYSKYHKLKEYKTLYKFAKTKHPIVLAMITNDYDDIKEAESQDTNNHIG